MNHEGARRGRGRDRMVVGFTTTCTISAITIKVGSSNPVHGEVYSIQHYVIQFVSDRSVVFCRYFGCLHQ